ncbi:MAG: hypothetical protein HND44_24210 [Chloroflexi bacterium]|nr:hypothetical protein [Ardenticatenaceae bacterium]MBL1131531.1 hypothetical protein [Chloroflexota bacterium]NOG37642.1 hypothetical protein [Chloroflexota bacterium]
MIVLDEQLLGRGLETAIAHWYQGTVCFITDLRPHTVIKDDAIPRLLQQENQPTFVTINESDFWRKVVINNRFCVVCFALPDSRANEISPLLRSLLRNPTFSTKKRRMGKIIRVTEQKISCYAFDDRRIRIVGF